MAALMGMCMVPVVKDMADIRFFRYSRKILRLHLEHANNNPRVIIQYFVEERGG